DPTQLLEDHVLGNKRDLGWQHHRAQYERKEHVVPPEGDPREAVGDDRRTQKLAEPGQTDVVDGVDEVLRKVDHRLEERSWIVFERQATGNEVWGDLIQFGEWLERQ